MSDHASARRTSRREQLRALAERGATEGERAAARAALDKYEAKHGPGRSRDPASGGSTPDILFSPEFDHRWAGMEHIREAAQAHVRDLSGVHEAEKHAGKIGTYVVWRNSHSDADWLQCWGRVRLRLPNGTTWTASRCAGKVHDTDNDRWGVLYRARDLESTDD